MKDLIAHEQGRDNSLAASESYAQAVKKLGSDTPVLWFVDLPKLIKLLAQTGVAANANGGNDANQVQQVQAMIQVTGLNGLKAAAGSFTLNTANFDSVTKMIVLIQGRSQGLLEGLPPAQGHASSPSRGCRPASPATRALAGTSTTPSSPSTSWPTCSSPACST